MGKTKVGGILLVAIVISGAIAALRYFAATEQPSKFYATYEEAEKDGATQRGWIPNFVPKSAFQIWETHDLDTNKQWMRFKFASVDGKLMVSGMTMVERSEHLKCNGDPGESWWKTKADHPLDIYRVSNDTGHLAVDWLNSEAYYWNR